MIETPVKSFGRKNLVDNGERVWDDEIRSTLDREYDDWKDPKRTYMVPPFFEGASNDAEVKGREVEEKFYNLLQKLGQNNNEPMFVVHSYDFSEHVPVLHSGRERSWVMGESDFVVIHRKHGPIFFQVKATETGKSYKEAENQIQKDKIALEIFFKRMEKVNISSRKEKESFKNCPAFVVMPNCPRGPQSVCTRDNVLYQEDCSSSEAFSSWWNDKIGKAQHPPLDPAIFEYLVMWFVGLTYTGHCLSYSIDKSHKKLVIKTREQLNVLLNSTPEQWITGPAGSGKTWLLMEKVNILAEKALLHETEEKILVVCYNKPLSIMFLKTFEQLKNFLQNGDKDWRSVVEVMTFDKLLYDIDGEWDCEKEQQVVNALERLEKGTCTAFIGKYDHIFVDECQDLCGDKWPILFKKLQKGSDDLSGDNDDGAFPDPKYIWYLYDTNQHLGLPHQQSKYLERALSISTRLSVVLRNTGNVFNQSRKYFKSDITGELKLGHQERGVAIKWDDSLTTTEDLGYQGAETLRKQICDLHRHKVKDRDICVLVRNTEARNALRSKLELLKVETQDAEELFVKGENKVIVESIWRFKGLESKVVILYNPPFFEDKDWTVKRTNEVLYTAVTRCFCYLVVITTRFGCEALQSAKGIHVHDSASSACNPPESHTKRHLGDDGDKDKAHTFRPKLSRMEAAKMHQQCE